MAHQASSCLYISIGDLGIWKVGEWLLIDCLVILVGGKKRGGEEALNIVIAQHSCFQLFSSRWEGLQWADTLKNVI